MKCSVNYNLDIVSKVFIGEKFDPSPLSNYSTTEEVMLISNQPALVSVKASTSKYDRCIVIKGRNGKWKCSYPRGDAEGAAISLLCLTLTSISVHQAHAEAVTTAVEGGKTEVASQD